jgi:hypothetical protein
MDCSSEYFERKVAAGHVETINACGAEKAAMMQEYAKNALCQATE